MRKTIYAMCVLVGMIFTLKPAKAQLEQGQLLFEGYYGYSISKKLFSMDIPSDAMDEVRMGFGPFGGRVEYMLSDKISVGVDMNYRYSSSDYNLDVTDSITLTVTNYDHSHSVSQLRVMGKLNVHFVNNEKTDFYGGFAVGYKNVQRTFLTENPYKFSGVTEAFIPVAMRLAIGYRYFINPNWAIGFEAGIGGGTLANIGICYAM